MPLERGLRGSKREDGDRGIGRKGKKEKMKASLGGEGTKNSVKRESQYSAATKPVHRERSCVKK